MPLAQILVWKDTPVQILSDDGLGSQDTASGNHIVLRFLIVLASLGTDISNKFFILNLSRYLHPWWLGNYFRSRLCLEHHVEIRYMYVLHT